MAQRTSETYSPLERIDLTEQTYRILREKIVTNQLKPGEKISVDDVAAQLRISRSPVTGALQRLANDGLVEIIPQRGTFVTTLTSRDVSEIFEIRLMIELHAAQHLLESQKTNQFIESARASMDTMRQAMVDDDYGDYEAFIQADHDLHLMLVQSTENQHLIEMYEKMNVHIQIARVHYLLSVERARQAYREHQVFLDAFRSGKPEQAQQALRDHIQTVQARIVEILTERGWQTS